MEAFMLKRKTYNQADLDSVNQFEGGESTNIIYKRRLKLPIPKKGETKDGYSEVQVLFLPSAGDNDTTTKNLAEVNILHAESGAFVAKYWTLESNLENDLANKTKWNIYNTAGKISTEKFRNIRISNRDSAKKFINVYVISHPNPEEVGKVKLWAYGKKVSEVVDAALKGSAVYEYKAPVNIMVWPLRIIIPEGISPSGLYDKAKFIHADEEYINSIYDRLDEDDLVDLEKLAANELDTGNSINPPETYVASLLQMAGYIDGGGEKKEIADMPSVTVNNTTEYDFDGLPA